MFSLPEAASDRWVNAYMEDPGVHICVKQILLDRIPINREMVNIKIRGPFFKGPRIHEDCYVYVDAVRLRCGQEQNR